MASKNRKAVEPESDSGSTEYETETSESDSETPNKPEPITEPKKSNIKPESSNSSKLKKWSDVDEIDILKGMIDYEANNNLSPNADMDAFLDYIKKNLNVDVTKGQLQDKIRRLKKKYENNKGKDRNVMKPREKAVFELSEKVWEGEEGKTVVALNASGSVVKKKTPSRKRKVIENSSGFVEKKAFVDLVMKRVGSFGLSNEEKLLRIGAELFEGEQEIEGSEKWKTLKREEMELCIKQLDVKRAKMRLVLDRME